MSDYGEVIMSRVDGVVRVDRADADALIADEFLDELREGLLPHVQADGDTITFGTEGEGLGRVTYRVGGRYDQWTRVMSLVRILDDASAERPQEGDKPA